MAPQAAVKPYAPPTQPDTQAAAVFIQVNSCLLCYKWTTDPPEIAAKSRVESFF
jgi:hypothetical protein